MVQLQHVYPLSHLSLYIYIYTLYRYCNKSGVVSLLLICLTDKCMDTVPYPCLICYPIFAARSSYGSAAFSPCAGGWLHLPVALQLCGLHRWGGSGNLSFFGSRCPVFVVSLWAVSVWGTSFWRFERAREHLQELRAAVFSRAWCPPFFFFWGGGNQILRSRDFGAGGSEARRPAVASLPSCWSLELIESPSLMAW